MITLNNIDFGYTPEKQIINHLSARFEKGRFISIIGPNGSGKTTLLDLISGFLTPVTGTILIEETPLSRLTKKSIAQKVALVSQDYTINFPFRVKDVVMMGRHPYIERFAQPGEDDIRQVDQIIDQCEIGHLKNRKINELSGGERQRCVFARALCQDTPILLLDEAFSNMDIRHTLDMLRLVKKNIQNKDTLVISVFHDLNLASSWSDDLLMLKDGQIIFSGPSQDIFTRESIKTVFHVDGIVSMNPDTQKRQVAYPAM